MSIWKEESGGGLPAGVSTEAKQDIGNTSLNNIDTAIGAKSDVKASTDTGTFSLIALIKRLLDKLTSIISVRITDGAGTANTRQLGSQLTNADVANSAVQEANGNGTITVTATGSVLFSIIVTQNTVMNEDIFEEDFLSYLGVSIADVSDQIVLCITPITATITAFGCLQYKEY